MANDKVFIAKNGITVGATAAISSAGAWVGSQTNVKGLQGSAGATGAPGAQGAQGTTGAEIGRAHV